MYKYYVPQRNRKSKKKTSRKKFYLLILLLLVAFGIYIGYKITRSLPEETVNLYELPAEEKFIPDSMLFKHVQAAITREDTELVAQSKNSQPAPIASMAKVITAVALQQKAPIRPGENGMKIVFNDADEELYRMYLAKDGAVSNVKTGEAINQYQALQAILLPSSNNITDTLVIRVFGSVKNYVDYANKMVEQLGMNDTKIDDASGFSPKTTSTPTDMLVIGARLLEDPVLSEIVSRETANIPLAGEIINHNFLIHEPDIIGIKPGNTDEAGLCLLFAARQGADSKKTRTVIGVVMGEDNPRRLFDTSRDLIDNSSKILTTDIRITNNQPIGEISVNWLKDPIRLSAQTAEESVIIKNARSTRPTFVKNDSIADRSFLGEIKFDKSSKQIKVQPERQITRPSLLWRIKHIFNF